MGQKLSNEAGRIPIVVRPVDSVGWRGLTIETKDGILIDLEPPPRVVGIGGRAATRAVSEAVTWEGVNDTGGSGVGTYEVAFESPTGGGVGVVNALARRFLVEGADGQNYEVRVRAVDRAGNAGPWSEPLRILFDRSGPSAPGNFSARVEGRTITFSWLPSEDSGSGLGPYVLYVGTIPGGNDVIDRQELTALSATIVGTHGVTYFGSVRAVDQLGNEGEMAIGTEGASISPETTATANGWLFSAIAVVSAAIIVGAVLLFSRSAAR